jgi:cobalt/nickel transport protein
MKKLSTMAVSMWMAAVCFQIASQPVQAHFQVLIPSTDIVTAEGSRTVDFTIAFTHPMEQGPIMTMEMPTQFGVLVRGQKKDLKGTLELREIEGKKTYNGLYTFKQPGDHLFYLEPAPYWEAAEEVMIIHYTKVVVNAMGAEEGWDKMVGFPVEIEPLVRPYGLWTGNAFRGIVKKDGEPVPFAELEVEYYNEGRHVKIPGDPFVTQVIKADLNGVFSYVMPKAGWWSFAALIEGDEKMQSPDGKAVDVELGALIWVKTVDMK